MEDTSGIGADTACLGLNTLMVSQPAQSAGSPSQVTPLANPPTSSKKGKSPYTKKKSDVWVQFDKVPAKADDGTVITNPNGTVVMKARCKICNAELVFNARSGTSHLRRHMISCIKRSLIPREILASGSALLQERNSNMHVSHRNIQYVTILSTALSTSENLNQKENGDNTNKGESPRFSHPDKGTETPNSFVDNAPKMFSAGSCSKSTKTGPAVEGALTWKSRSKKQERSSLQCQYDTGEDDNDDDDDSDHLALALESEKEESGILVNLMDREVLDCSICMEPLSPPVFQCENGHIACSSCCTKLHNKCPSCACPIGYSRCLAIEKVIESIRVYCRYRPYGCAESFSNKHRHIHEESCMYAPFTCPYTGCDFRGSSKQLSLHFSSKHQSSVKRFQFNSVFSVSFGKSEPYLVLEEEDDGLLFVLHIKQIELVGSAIAVTCLGPSSLNRELRYILVSRKGDSSLRLESHVKCAKEQNEASSCLNFLLVPYDFYCSSGELRLDITILK